MIKYVFKACCLPSLGFDSFWKPQELFPRPPAHTPYLFEAVFRLCCLAGLTRAREQDSDKTSHKTAANRKGAEECCQNPTSWVGNRP